MVEVAPAVRDTGERRVAFLLQQSPTTQLILDIREVELTYTETGAMRFGLPTRLLGDLSASYAILMGHRVPLILTELEKW